MFSIVELSVAITYVDSVTIVSFNIETVILVSLRKPDYSAKTRHLDKFRVGFESWWRSVLDHLLMRTKW